jgi:hypothetical protein
MVFLSVSFIGSLIQGIFFPSDNAFKIKPPILYSKSKMEQNTNVNNEKEMVEMETTLLILILFSIFLISILLGIWYLVIGIW